VQPGWSPASAYNFRDIGGLPTAGGGTLKSGLLYRSATPQFMTSADVEHLVDSAGVSLVVDLRFTHEVDAEGSGYLDQAPVRHLKVPVVGEGGDTIGNAVLAGTRDVLAGHYVSYVEHNAGAFVEVISALAAPDGTPALVHCAAGKDRTGVAMALLLSTLGVPDEEIIADYARTAEQMPALLRRLAQTPTYGPALAIQPADDPMSKARPETMRLFLDWLARTHGSATDLLHNAGLEPGALDDVRELLVDRAAA
jgi:hypothetical protein